MVTKQVRDAPATLESVAALAGVSRATAGRVLSGATNVSEGARTSVLDAARQLSYVTNQAARSLVTRRSGSVAFVVAEAEDRAFGDPFFPGLLRGAHAEVSAAGKPGVRDGDRRAGPPALERFAAGGHVDAAVFVSLHGDDPLPRTLRDAGVPVVLSGRPYRAGTRFPFVDADNEGGAALAAHELVDRGSRRPATVTGPADMIAGEDRLAGFRRGLQERGVALPPSRVVAGDFTIQSGYAATERLLRQRYRPDGVFAANDQMAVGAMQALREHGVSVPGEVRVVGFDDAPLAAATHPGLTTVRQPVEQARPRDGAGWCSSLAADPAAARGRRVPSRVLPTELVRRGTT
ncbi:LacI family transcriptional regulator [Angustibacter aerolatus]|uniref:LacI family transcriptional regulator n=1 Tax=Angustibacter aerolatus TaxID=1162965 RepID=A0ABQ6JHS6_9ACTN|nr:LacI family DNA-binding transcriptional regulator [Angustibacter aerolatus]GMA87758.1 LacI family transcriptional regulator [Angustibacter aerolatus]